MKHHRTSPVNNLNIVTYNCKNAETSKYAIEELSELTDIVLIQEHWYFDCQLGNLSAICDSMTGTGKGVDTGEPILPVQMPRGYGGVGILWKQTIDHLVRVLPDGGNRIQCVELLTQQPAAVISAYMPCKGLHDNVDEFQDSLAQLQEIIQKFKSSHFIQLGGDFNECLTAQKATKRLTSIRKFLAENQLSWQQTGKTYIGPNGVETSTIDYIFYSLSIQDRVCGTRVMDDFAPNVSYHYPTLCSFDIQLSAVRSTSETTFPPSKVKWEKIDRTSIGILWQ